MSFLGRLHDVLHSDKKLTLVFEYCDQVSAGRTTYMCWGGGGGMITDLSVTLPSAFMSIQTGRNDPHREVHCSSVVMRSEVLAGHYLDNFILRCLQEAGELAANFH